MIVEPQTVTLTISELFAILRDMVFVVGFAISGWKLRSWIQPGIDFFKRATTHMDVMELGMEKLLENHLPHIESALKPRGEVISTDVPPEA
jgi:hypothetical protein